MNFFRRLFGLESKEEKLQRQLENQKNNVLEILRKDGNATEELLDWIATQTFTDASFLSLLNDLLKVEAISREAQDALAQNKEETIKMITEAGILMNDDTVEIIEEVPQTNMSLLSEITNNLNQMIAEISENNKRIVTMEQRLRVLKQDTADIDQIIQNLKQRMNETNDLEEKERLINQIQTLEADKKVIDASATSIQKKIGEIQKLVASQSAQLSNFQQGSGPKSTKRMSRRELDARARAMHLMPSRYKTKKDIQDVIELMNLAKRLPLKKMDKKRLAVISRNFDIDTKSKRTMLDGLKKFKIIR